MDTALQPVESTQEVSSAQQAPEAPRGGPLPGQAQEGWPFALLCLAGAGVLGLTLQLTNGTQRPDALGGLTATLLLMAAAVAAPRTGRASPWLRALPALVAGAALLGQLRELYTAPPGMFLQLEPGPWPYARFHVGVALLALLTGAALTSSERPRRWLVLGMVGVFLVIGLWVLRASPAPFIDVLLFLREGPQALLEGRNPYALTFPNIYGHTLFYGEGVVRDGRMQFGFPYPPLSLYLATLGQGLAGDPRLGHLAAVGLAAGLMASTRGGPVGAAAAGLLLLTPRGFFVLEQAWTEPLVLLLLAASVFCAVRAPRALPYALGLLLVAKQYAFLLLPLVPLLVSPRGPQGRAFLVRMGATAALACLPLALPDVVAFLRSTVELHLRQPFRMDALSYLSWWAGQGHPRPSAAWGFFAVALASALALWRAPRSPAGFAASAAWVLGVFFAFNKQAFCNYYFLVVGALCVAAAAGRYPAAPLSPPPTAAPPPQAPAS